MRLTLQKVMAAFKKNGIGHSEITALVKKTETVEEQKVPALTGKHKKAIAGFLKKHGRCAMYIHNKKIVFVTVKLKEKWAWNRIGEYSGMHNPNGHNLARYNAMRKQQASNRMKPLSENPLARMEAVINGGH